MALCGEPTCLGLPEWTDCCKNAAFAQEPPAVAPETTNGSASERFKYFVSDEQLSELSKGYTPKNTEASTKWALKNFLEWTKARNVQFPSQLVPTDILSSSDPATLNMWLSRFAVETRNTKGEFYPPSSLCQLLTGLLRHMRTINPNCPNFLEKTNPQFKVLHGTLDVHFRRLHECGIGRKTNHAQLISKEDENKLWSCGILGTSTPRSLLNAVFFYNGKNFCLRGGDEHRHLRLSQLKRLSDPDHYVYYENCSKNRAGTFRQKHVENKVVPVYCTCTESSDHRCHVHLLDLYIQKLPKAAVEQDIFYMRPLHETPRDPSHPWFANCPIGRNTLASIVKKMCSEAGMEGKRTNHSLRATGATELFRAHVPEKLIQQRTGHRSIEALRVYERTTGEQHRTISAIQSSSQTLQYSETNVSRSNISNAPTASGQVNFTGLTNCTINVIQQPEKENVPPRLQ